jgi:ankyrin repeat protein
MYLFSHPSATTPLIVAVRDGRLEVVRMLLKANASVELADEYMKNMNMVCSDP